MLHKFINLCCYNQAFRSPPPFASLLYCHTAPPPGSGADTAFADMTAALASLPLDKQAQLADLRAVVGLYKL